MRRYKLSLYKHVILWRFDAILAHASGISGLRSPCMKIGAPGELLVESQKLKRPQTRRLSFDIDDFQFWISRGGQVRARRALCVIYYIDTLTKNAQTHHMWHILEYIDVTKAQAPVTCF